jgi:hypothetical protein
MKTPIGDIKGFFYEMIRNICFVMGIGYMGGSFTTLCQVNEITLESLFPTDIKNLPYFSKDPTPATIKDGPWEYLFPMKHVGFPYNKINYESNSIYTDMFNWFIYTLAFAFIKIRESTFNKRKLVKQLKMYESQA